MISPVNIGSKFPNMGTTIFTVMSQMAAKYNAINLAQGFPSFEPPLALTQLVTKYTNSGKNQYAPMAGVIELRKAIADNSLATYSAEYNPESEITITPGATVGIFCAIQAVVKENDEVIIIEPAYDCYAPAVIMAGGKPKYVQIDLETQRIDWKNLQKLISYSTKAIIINSPNNPLGYTLSSQDLHELERIVTAHDIVVISDEVYEYMIFDNLEHQSVQRFPNLAKQSFVIGSFGKTYHATGWKVGFVLAPENLMEEFRKVYQFVAFSTNSVMQYAIAEFMQNTTWNKDLAPFYEQKRNYLRQLLKPSRFKLMPCNGSYFQTVCYKAISSKNGMDMATYLTKEIGVATIPVSAFYHSSNASLLLRLCFAKDDAILEQAAQKLCQL